MKINFISYKCKKHFFSLNSYIQFTARCIYIVLDQKNRISDFDAPPYICAGCRRNKMEEFTPLKENINLDL